MKIRTDSEIRSPILIEGELLVDQAVAKRLVMEYVERSRRCKVSDLARDILRLTGKIIDQRTLRYWLREPPRELHTKHYAILLLFMQSEVFSRLVPRILEHFGYHHRLARRGLEYFELCGNTSAEMEAVLRHHGGIEGFWVDAMGNEACALITPIEDRPFSQVHIIRPECVLSGLAVWTGGQVFAVRVRASRYSEWVDVSVWTYGYNDEVGHMPHLVIDLTGVEIAGSKIDIQRKLRHHHRSPEAPSGDLARLFDSLDRGLIPV